MEDLADIGDNVLDGILMDIEQVDNEPLEVDSEIVARIRQRVLAALNDNVYHITIHSVVQEKFTISAPDAAQAVIKAHQKSCVRGTTLSRSITVEPENYDD